MSQLLFTDASKFGQAYLSKLGWDPSKGLGVSGDGRTSHIKVAQKLNLMGIGAGAQQGPDGIAWKQNKDYELLLARLNETEASERVDITVSSENKEEGQDQTGEKGEKRKRGETDLAPEDELEERQKRKRERKERKAMEKEKKRLKKEKQQQKQKDDGSESPENAVAEASSSAVTLEAPSPRPIMCVLLSQTYESHILTDR